MNDRHAQRETQISPASGNSNDRRPPTIPDHELIRVIGSGSYGEVWLARSVMGTFRAVKVVYGHSFEDPRPYEREFSGIKRFEPVSRTHEGLVDILQVGRNERDRLFYYIMELADDVDTEQEIHPQAYVAKTLGSELNRRNSLPFDEALQLSIRLVDGLAHLHKHSLIHRDLKPSNIIFVNGIPKIADIGLVAEVGSSRSFVGTEGFIPPEGPGTVKADIYSLGKVIYELSSGKDRLMFPELPTYLGEIPDRKHYLELNEVTLKACEADPRRRYGSAEEMRADLVLLQAGKSVKRLRALERRLAILTRIAMIAAFLLLIGAFAYFQVVRARQLATRRLAESLAEYGARSQESGDLIGSLPWLAAAARLEHNDPARVIHRRVNLGVSLRQCPTLDDLWFHNGTINQVEFSPDGSHVVAACASGEVVIWTSGLQEPVKSFQAHSPGTEAEAASFSNDGRFLVTAGLDGMAKIWDAKTYALLHVFPHPQAVYGAQISGDGSLVVTACADGYARAWNTTTGELIRAFGPHKDVVRDVHLNSDETMIITASHDTTAQIWDLATAERIGEPLRHGNWVYQAAFSPDGRQAVTAEYDNAAHIWNIETGKRVRSLEHDGAVRSARFSDDGRFVVTACWDVEFTTRIWDAQTGIQAVPALKHNSYINHAEFAPSDYRVVTASCRGAVFVWSLFPPLALPDFQRVFYSADASQVASITTNGIELRSPNTDEPILLPTTNQIRQVILSKRSHIAVAITEQQSATNREKLMFAQSFPLSTSETNLPRIALNPKANKFLLGNEGNLLAAIHGDAATLYQLTDGRVWMQYRTKKPIATGLFSNRDNDFLMLCDTNIYVWNRTNHIKPRLLRHSAEVKYAEFSQDGRYLIVACSPQGLDPGYAQIWDFTAGHPVGTPLFHENDGVSYATLSHSSKRAVTAGEDKVAVVWDPVTGTPVAPPLIHRGQVLSAVFSPNDEWIATSCLDGSIRIWETETGKPVTPALHTGWGRNIAVMTQFIADGTVVLAKRANGLSRSWNLTPDLRPIEDLELLAQLLSGHRSDQIHTGGTWPLTQSELKRAWITLNAKYPDSLNGSRR